MEPDGIRNGSTINDLSIKTINITGNNARAYSTRIFSLETSLNNNKIPPVTSRAINNMSEKSTFIP